MLRRARFKYLAAASALVMAMFGSRMLDSTAANLAAASQPAAQPAAAKTAPARNVLTTSCDNGTLVQTDKGQVCGATATGMKNYYGVPFAAAPVGSLRWQPPQPHAQWSDILQAVNQPPACPQSTSVPGNEDCLDLNVQVPTDAGSGPLPVLVHIYGGGFAGGFISQYNGTRLASTGHVIFVGVQYRVGVLGFLADQAFGSNSGDYGLQDQQAGLAWVQQNIAAFGGDPNNVTILGESAGGSSVCDQIASPTAAGLFQKAISESGEYNSSLGAATNLGPQDCHATLSTAAEAEQQGASYAAALGCTNPSTAGTCMRNLPTSTLLANPPPFGLDPIINGTTLTQQPTDAFTAGSINRVPTIIGVDRDEAFYNPTTATEYQNLIQAQYGSHASDVLSRYPLARYATPYIAYRTVAADSNTVCPAVRVDERLSKWMTVYAVEFDNADTPGSFLSADLPGGAWHTSESYFNFDFLPASSIDPNQQVFGNEITAEWTAFARTGNPTTTGTPSWPQYTHTSPQIMSMQPAGDSELTTASAIAFDHHCDYWDGIATTG